MQQNVTNHPKKIILETVTKQLVKAKLLTDSVQQLKLKQTELFFMIRYYLVLCLFYIQFF